MMFFDLYWRLGCGGGCDWVGGVNLGPGAAGGGG